MLPLVQLLVARRLVCTKCENSYTSLAKRWGSNRALKVWWDAKSEHEKVEWFVKQFAVPSGSVRTLDVTVQEVSKKRSFDVEEDLDHFIPFEDYETPRLIRGMTASEIKSSFEALVATATDKQTCYKLLRVSPIVVDIQFRRFANTYIHGC